MHKPQTYSGTSYQMWFSEYRCFYMTLVLVFVSVICYCFISVSNKTLLLLLVVVEQQLVMCIYFINWMDLNFYGPKMAVCISDFL